MKVSATFLNVLVNQAPAMGMRVVYNQNATASQLLGIVWTRFNPLTESYVLAEVDFEELSDGSWDLSYQLRDHDGNGPMLPCNPMVSYHHGDEFVLHEFLCEALDYIHEQNQKYLKGIEANARALAFTGDIHKFHF